MGFLARQPTFCQCFGRRGTCHQGLNSAARRLGLVAGFCHGHEHVHPLAVAWGFAHHMQAVGDQGVFQLQHLLAQFLDAFGGVQVGAVALQLPSRF